MKRIMIAATTLIAGSQAHNIQGGSVKLNPPRQMEVRLTTETYEFAQDHAGHSLLTAAMQLGTCQQTGLMNSRWNSQLTLTRISSERQMVYVQSPYAEYWDGTCSGKQTRVNLTLKSGWNEIVRSRSGLVQVISARATSQ